MTDEVRLSPQQRRLWLAGNAAGAAFTARCELALDGALDEAILAGVVQGLVDRHEILRTSFPLRPWLKVPLQAIAPTGAVEWRTVDLAGREEGPALDGLWRAEAARPFDLERAPLVRALLAGLAPRQHRLLLILPALCCDLRSLGLLAGEIERDYLRRTGAAAGDGAPAPLQYADYSEWQHELLAAGDGGAAGGRAHWARQDLSVARALRLDGEGEPGPEFQPESVRCDLEPELAAALERLAGETGTALENVLLAGWMALLWRLSGQPEVVIGKLFDGRRYADLAAGIGLFARCLPVRGLTGPRLRFRDCLAQVHGAERQAWERQDHCDWEEDLKLAGEDLISPFGFELDGLPAAEQAAAPVIFRRVRREAWSERCRLKLTCWREGGALGAELGFDPSAFAAGAVRDLGRQLRALLERAAADPEALLETLDPLPPEDLRLWRELNDTAADLPAPRCFHRMVEEQAGHTPEWPAVVFEEQSLSYGELNARANRLARHLRSLGVGTDVRVAILAERSAEVVVALLGVLKAGGAYVPLDPAYPPPRLAAMLADSGAAVVLGEDRLLAGWTDAALPVVRLEADRGEIERWDGGDLPGETAQLESLAYVLFTSGSTGRPKGVGVEHRQLAHYLQAILRELRPAAGEGFATVSTFTADLGNTVVFPALATGGCLHVLSPERIADSAALADYFSRHAIDVLKIVPSHLAALGEGGLERVLPRRVLVLGGETASADLVDRLRQGARPEAVLNHYGPTETTVGATTCRLARTATGGLPLGRPLAGTRAHALDPWLRPVPAGVPGELFIGGGGVARGYLGDPGATAGRFVPDSFGGRPGERLYRTGDLARLRPDGDLEFLGRVDQQVKIRGFRIEPGEIESALAQHPAVREALVLAREERLGERRLAAFAVLRRGVMADAAELRAHLRQRLPEHMVPSAVTLLESLPRTPNGKVDRQALLSLEAEGGPRRTAAVPPRTPVEAALADIWAEVLGVERVGISDNFFELGGDSIQVIQVVARTNKLGLRLTPRQLFQHQTIADLVAAAGTLPAVAAEQGAVVGEVPLTPIQRWFFELDPPSPHHWNQAALLAPRGEVEVDRLEAALGALVAHHDALRLRFQRTAEGWRQELAAPDGAFRLVRYDLSALPAGARGAALAHLTAGLQGGLDLERGPLLRAAWFDLGRQSAGRLLLAFHHLAVDGVSWRVLLEDLTAALDQLAAGEELRLPAKTTSFKQWAERLAGHARSAALEAELPFWLEMANPAGPPLPLDLPPSTGADDEAAQRTTAVALDAATTRDLLHELPAHGIRTDDALLAALLLTFARWTGEPELRIDLEGHGREPLFDDVDLSRTVGWFTTHFPVRLQAPAGAAPAEVLAAVKERLRAVPGRGIGHGLLRYLGRPEVADRLAAAPPPRVSFNYLGQFDPTFSGSPFRRAAEPAGPNRSPAGRRPYLLQVSCLVIDGRLQVEWHASARRHHPATIERLADGFLDALRELVDACRSGAAAWSAADFPLAGIDQPTLDRLLRGGRRVEDLYPLSPLQHGLLFHSLYEPGSGLYVGQFDCVLAGDLDLAAFEEAWRTAVARHPIFRTAFLWEGLDSPLQLVAPQAELPVERHDWSGLSGDQRQSRLEAWFAADRESGYDLARPPLMRLALCRLGPTSHQMIWSHHHLLLDGWSIALLAKEVFGIYGALRAERPLDLPPTRPYRDYIAWLQEGDLARAREFWRQALRGFAAPNSLASIRTGKAGADRQGLADSWLNLPAAPTRAIQELLRRHQLTWNTLVQGVWAVLLSRYSGDQDVVFGATVAGRPTDLVGFESMIGLFINTLPVRVRVAPEAALLPWLADLQHRQVEARQYEFTPLIEIQAESELPRGVPLFESVLVVENYPADDGRDRGVEIRDMRYAMKENFPLIFTVVPGAELRIKIKYDSALFSRPAIARMADFFLAVLERIAGGGELRLTELSAALAEAERKRQNRGEQALKDARLQRFEQVKRKAVRSS